MYETSYDAFAWKLANALLEDFEPHCAALANKATGPFRSQHIADVRTLRLTREGIPPFQYKMLYQLEHLFKKYSFSNDVYTADQLRESSIEKFMDNQKRLVAFTWNEDETLGRILYYARDFVDQVMGDRDNLEICSEARFGKKSSVGVPMREACEGARYEAPISGSRPHIDWFEHYYGVYNRPAYHYAVSRRSARGPAYREVNELKAVLVDKTWKSLRMIMPNTTLGTLYSGGLGVVIEKRLRAHGYDIRDLQQKHRAYAQRASLDGSLVTADQSLASDNITVALIRRLFNRSWAASLEYGRIDRIDLYGRFMQTPTFSTMGIGFTFPLQTLVFLSLLHGIRTIMGDETLMISAYGDDLVYSTSMHDLVAEVFPKLGLLLNEDKTFHAGDFRESCGGDYYRGLDVRPFFLGRSPGTPLRGRHGEAYVYKVFNGLMARWRPEDVPGAVQLCLNTLDSIKGGKPPYIVPNEYPDTAGLKALDWRLGEYSVTYLDRRGAKRFPHLGFRPKMREESRETPYYFLSLRDGGKKMDLPMSNFSPNLKRLWKKGHGFICDCTTERLVPVVVNKVDAKGKYRRSFTAKRGIPEQGSGHYTEQLGYTLE